MLDYIYVAYCILLLFIPTYIELNYNAWLWTNLYLYIFTFPFFRLSVRPTANRATTKTDVNSILSFCGCSSFALPRWWCFIYLYIILHYIEHFTYTFNIYGKYGDDDNDDTTSDWIRSNRRGRAVRHHSAIVVLTTSI